LLIVAVWKRANMMLERVADVLIGNYHNAFPRAFAQDSDFP
jgi:hypothetical protein